MSLLTILDKDDGFSPKSVANLVLWLDASDLASVVKDGSDLVSQWSDKSGNGQDRTQVTSGKKPTYVGSSPINGKPAIYFSADPQFLGDNSSTINPRGNLTIFTVFRFAGHTNWGHLFSMCHAASDGQGSPGLGFENTTNSALITCNSALTTTGKISLATGTGISGSNNVSMYRRSGGTNGNGGAVNLECRGGVNVTASGTQIWQSYDGDNYFIGRQGMTTSVYKTMNGYIAEHLCFERALSAAEQNRVWGYLRSKWGI